MSGWLLRRALQAAVTFLVALVILFVLMRAAPGDPLLRLGGDRPISPREIAVLRARYGLDQPVGTQLASFLQGLVHGDLGVSIEYGRPVTALLGERLPATLLLGGSVLLLNFTVGLWLGVRQAVRRGRREDRWLTTLSLAGYAMPSFWLGLVLAWLVGIHWRLLPAAGMQDPLLSSDAGWGTRAADVLSHLVLPALTLSVVSIA
ncbi:MAG TPA: ABC transporter permease, partial [Gemmatimonadales bacterium]|nr:ABC transporter permease [Gemmatimonadales bacterium]